MMTTCYQCHQAAKVLVTISVKQDSLDGPKLTWYVKRYACLRCLSKMDLTT